MTQLLTICSTEGVRLLKQAQCFVDLGESKWITIVQLSLLGVGSYLPLSTYRLTPVTNMLQHSEGLRLLDRFPNSVSQITLTNHHDYVIAGEK
jgi:hypothetical protein